jgi:hypothetical protein
MIPPSFDDNISQLPEEIRDKALFVPHDWSKENLPTELKTPLTIMPVEVSATYSDSLIAIAAIAETIEDASALVAPVLIAPALDAGQ